MSSHPKPRRTVTLTIRTEDKVLKALIHEADDRKITVNTFVSQILADYVDWGRHAEKYGSVEIAHDGLAQLFDLLDDDTLAKYGKDTAQKRWKSLISIWHGQMTPEEVLKFVVFWLEKTKQAKIAFSKNEMPRRIVAFHKLGRKGSIVFKNAIETMFELANKKVVVDARDDQFSFIVE